MPHHGTMAASEELVLLSRDDEKIASLAVIPLARRSSSVPMATFRLVVVQPPNVADQAIEKAIVSFHVPVGELRDREGAVDDVFQFLVAKIDHPALRMEVAREAKKAVAHVRARCAVAAAAAEEEGEAEEKLVDVEFRLLVLPGLCQEDEEEEEVGSDLELDDEAWQRGASDGEHWRDVHDDDDNHAGAQFTARYYDGGREGGPAPSAEALLLRDDFEVHSDGPEFLDQHELTARDVHRLVLLAVNGGDVDGDEAYQRAFHGNAPVTRVSMAAMLQQALESIKLRSPSPTPRMRTGSF